MSSNLILSSFTLDELKTVITDAIKEELIKVNEVTKTKEPEFLTRNETSTILGISLPTLNEWTKSGIITGYRIGTRIRYKKEEVHNSLKEIEIIKYKGNKNS